MGQTKSAPPRKKLATPSVTPMPGTNPAAPRTTKTMPPTRDCLVDGSTRTVTRGAGWMANTLDAGTSSLETR